MHELWKRSGLWKPFSSLDNVEKQGHKHYYITMANIKTKPAVEEDQDKRNPKSILADVSQFINITNISIFYI